MSNGQNEDDVGRTFDTQSGRETGAVGSALHIHTPTFGRLTNLLDCLAELCLKISCRSGTALSVPLDRGYILSPRVRMEFNAWSCHSGSPASPSEQHPRQ